MKPITTRNENSDFVKPKEWDDAKDGPCGPLSVRRELIGKRTYHYSTWKPSAEELAALNAGNVIELTCVGVQPPVALAVVPEAK